MVRARKRFGQNFLHDEVVLQQIQSAVAPKPDDWIFEIGPGQGALTRQFYGLCARLQAVEIDRDLIAGLQAQFPNLELTSNDILRVDMAGLLAGDENHAQPAWRVVGNLPYNLSTPLLGRLLAQHGLVRDMHFMLQKEVAERLAAVPSTKAWGRLSVMIQYHCDVELLFDVAPESFTPAPAVQSSVVRLTPHATLAGGDGMAAALERCVALAFQQRRKRLSNALKTLELDFDQLPVDPGARPDQLSTQDYLAIAQHVMDRSNDAKGDV
ncbi:UNVERIFIED_CONTAM: hypothetical protein GTU68_011105 [Idotea baltica]|nr:hypothetical protein [Idotea baltica]